MTPEARRYLAKAHQQLARARTMLDVSLHEDAGRAAYLAGFHAAQAMIFETVGRLLKTHKGVQTEFLRLTKDDTRFDPELRTFLSTAYNLKSIADYETGPGSDVSSERARLAVDTAAHFVARIVSVLEARDPS